MPSLDPSSAGLRVRVPAKINPFLALRGVREDGYHELVTVFQTVALHDQLELVLNSDRGRLQHPTASGRVAVTMTHDGGHLVPDGEENLVLQAAERLAGVAGLTIADDAAVRTRITLSKRIPVAGGMAGGSADAAAALLGLSELWGADVARADLLDLAARLGADVPFCLVGGTALATGTGTGFVRVLCRGTFHWVVCTAAEPLATAAVYASWDDHCTPGGAEPAAVLAAVATGDADALGAALHNDLQPAAEALRPRLRADRKALLDAGAIGAVLSGSGPTLLALAGDADEAQRISARVAPRFDRVMATTSPAGGPVIGPC